MAALVPPTAEIDKLSWVMPLEYTGILNNLCNNWISIVVKRRSLSAKQLFGRTVTMMHWMFLLNMKVFKNGRQSLQNKNGCKSVPNPITILKTCPFYLLRFNSRAKQFWLVQVFKTLKTKIKSLIIVQTVLDIDIVTDFNIRLMAFKIS